MAVMQLWMCRKCFPLGMSQIWAKYGPNVQQRSHLVPLRWVGPRTSAASFDLDFHHHCSSASKKSNIPECPYDVGQEDNVEDDDKEDRDSEEPGVALEVQPYILIFLSMLSMFGGKCEALFGDIQVCSLGEYLSTLEVDPALRVVFQLQKTLRSFL